MSHPFAESARAEHLPAPPRRRRYKRPHPANEDRRRTAAARQSQRAQEALRVLSEMDVSATPVWRKRWKDVLQLRAADSESSLAQLAASMSPPMTKSAFSCQLDRAINAAGLAAGDPADQQSPQNPSSPPAASSAGPSVPESDGPQRHTSNGGSALAPALSALGGRQ
jgi:hypothetical protein